MNKRYALRVCVCAHCRKQRRNAGTDIRAKHDEQRQLQGKHPSADHHDDDTRRRRGALNKRRENDTDKNEKKREIYLIEDTDEQSFNKLVAERLFAAHNVKTYENQAKTAAQAACDFNLFFFHKAHHNACKRKQVHGKVEIIVFKGYKQTRYGGTDVGTHDNRRRLHQRQHPCVNKTDDHDRRCGRALYNCRHACADPNPRKTVVADLAKQFFHSPTGTLFQRAA